MKVKSCPCCGSVNSLGIQAKFISSNLLYRVICNDKNENWIDDFSDTGCGLRTGWFRTIQEAVEKWNQRTIIEAETEIPTTL